MKYYKLDIDGTILKAFARPQEGMTLELLDEPPTEYHDKWDGSQWVLNTAKKDAADVEAALPGEIRALQFIQEWEDRLRGKTAAQIVDAFNNATAAQKSELLLAHTLRWALEIK